MADRRPDIEDNGRAKRQKGNGADMDPKANSYLAHMYDEQEGYSNSYGSGRKSKNNLLAGFMKHETTVEQAKVTENRPYNSYNRLELSKRPLTRL
jgi:hypothetical protein